MDWFQIGNGVHQGCILSPSYLTYVKRTSAKCRLDEAQAGIKVAWRYTDDTTLMAESKEGLKSLLMRVKE